MVDTSAVRLDARTTEMNQSPEFSLSQHVNKKKNRLETNQQNSDCTTEKNTDNSEIECWKQLFLYDKKREIFPETKRWSNQPQNVMFVVKVFWWLCTENFGPLRIPRPATNFLPQKNRIGKLIERIV